LQVGKKKFVRLVKWFLENKLLKNWEGDEKAKTEIDVIAEFRICELENAAAN
jgi:hypothetical protein